MYDIVAIGELLIDFIPEVSRDEIVYIANPGGAPCNYLAMAAQLGARTTFVGKVGNDKFGKYLKKELEDHGIDSTYLKMDKDVNTTLAFVHLEEGERSFSFYRRGCSDIQLESKDIDYTVLNNTKMVHFGSLSLTDEPIRSTILEFLEEAKNQDVLISYDPNYRDKLWENEDEARWYMKLGLGYANYVKMSEEELEFITREKNVEKASLMLMKEPIRLLCVTLGERGVFYRTQHMFGWVSGHASKVVDTTGAGDAFFGALMAQLIQSDTSRKIEEIELIHYLKVANCAASLCIEKYGGMKSLPDVSRIETRLLSSIRKDSL